MRRFLSSLLVIGALAVCLAPSTASACHKKNKCAAPTPTCVVVKPCPPPAPPCPPPAPVCETKVKKGCGHFRLFAKRNACHKCQPAPVCEAAPAPAPCAQVVTVTYTVTPTYVYAAPQAPVTAAPQAEVVNPAPQAPTK